MDENKQSNDAAKKIPPCLLRAIGSLRHLFALALAAAMLLPGTTALAGEAPPSVKFAKFLDALEFSGDLRIRHESIFYGGGVATIDRHRQRFRLRLNTTLHLPDGFLVVVRLASGAGEAVATNQTFDNLSVQKELWIDRAYVVWNIPAADFLTLLAGRMANPFFVVYSTDVVWDDDVNPEGFAEQVTLKQGDVVLFVNLAQIVLDEDSGDNHDQWLFGQQAGVTAGFDSSEATLALAYYHAINTAQSTLGQNPTQQGNTRTAAACVASIPPPNCLLNDYHILNITAALKLGMLPVPVQVMADYIKNLANTVTVTNTESGSQGYQFGLIVGKASKAGTFEGAYFYKSVQTDATLADISDSDFGNGGIDRRGHIFWVAYNPTDFVQIKAKYFITETDTPLTVGDVNRFQGDVAVKF